VSVLAVGFVTPLIDGIVRPQTFVLGAIIAAVSPSVVVPLIQRMQMESEPKAILAVESALSDAISITVTVALLEIFRIGGTSVGAMAGQFVASFAMAVVIGAGGAFFWSAVLNRVRTLQNSLFLTLAFVLIIFGVTQWLGFAGYISSLVFGITLGNMTSFNRDKVRQLSDRDFVPLSETEKTFSSEMVFLLKTFFFVYIGISIRLDQPHLLLTGFLLSLMILFLRLPVVKLTITRSASVQDVSSMAVMVPKGLATAVLASVPLNWGIPGGATIQGIAYSTILSSIVITSAMILLLRRTRFSRLYDWLFSNFRH
jgi:NhaP-type Na+/H+ or K+/H+ antiporter